ncbi:MAG: hypothetical protein CSA62_12820 [Planctomycetota bacterium]|nr:MAG: hypothetical protein CSA62_12820 [Planctomycetota bacterium]
MFRRIPIAPRTQIKEIPVIRTLPFFVLSTVLAAPTFAAVAGEDSLVLPNEEQNKAAVTKSIEDHYQEAKELKGRFIDYLGIDEGELTAIITDHMRLVVPTDEQTATLLAQIGEYAYRRLNWVTFGKLDANSFKGRGGKQCYYRISRDSYDDMVVLLAEVHPTAISKGGVRSILQESHNNGGLTMAGANPPLELSKDGGDISSWVANGMGFSWLMSHCMPAMREVNLKSGQRQGIGSGGRGRGHLMTWLINGVAIWASMDTIGLNRMSRFTKSVYANSGKKGGQADFDYIAIAYEVAANKISKKIPTKNLYQITTAKLNDLTDVDYAMAWSLVDFFITQRNAEWRKLISACGKSNNFRYPFINAFGSDKQREHAGLAMKKKNDRGLSDVYRQVCVKVEGDWRKWAKKRWRAAYRDPSKAVLETPFSPIRRQGDKPEGDGEKKGKRKKKRRRRR